MKKFLQYFKRFLFTLIVIAFTATILPAQVAINEDGTNPDNSAMLDVKSADKGLLIPRLTTAARNTLTATAVAGLMVWDEDLNKFFFFNGVAWDEGSVGGSFWTRSGSFTNLLNTADYVGIGTTTPARTLDVRGPWKTARISSTSFGATLEFVSTTADDWAVTTWSGSLYLLNSTDDFATKTDEYIFNTSGFYPVASNAKILGASSNQWSTLFSVAGNFSGAVATGALTTTGNATFSGNVGIGTITPQRPLEVKGTARTARINSTTNAAYLEFLGTDATDWAIGTEIGSMRMESSTDGFATSTNRYFFGTAYFHPFANNARSLGISAYRWSNLYSYDGNFSDDVTIADVLTVSGTASIGTATQLGKLHVHDAVNQNTIAYISSKTTNDSATLFFSEGTGGTLGMYWMYDGYGDEMELWGRSNTSADWGPHLLVKRNSGDMAIGGTFATGYKLSVDGKIICEELRVDLSTGWPDYVFGKDYKLMSLQELDSFIETNGHLPNIPAAEEIQESGLEVGEMQRLMMEKIEELSLYVIQQQKEIDELKEQINKNQE